jgi:type VI secretion system protein ImpJ
MERQLPIIPAIQWHEGMFLSPQHFQQADLRNQQLLSYHLQTIAPFHWGVQHLKLDPVVLPTGIIRVLEVNAIMPDGFIVTYPSPHETSVLELNLTALKTSLGQQDTLIYLCLPEVSLSQSTVTGDWPRYESVEGGDVIDQNLPDNVIRIPRLLPKLSLIASAHPPARYVSIPLAKIGFEDESFVLKSYISPCTSSSRTTKLGEQLGNIARRIREKAAYLSEKWQNQIGTPLIHETGSLLRPLIQTLPLIEMLYRSDALHPYQIYQKLCEAAGALATLRLGQVPPTFPEYKHHDILESFEPILNWLNITINSIEKNFSVFLFSHENRLFSLKLHPSFMSDELLIGLRAPGGMTEAELKDWFNESIIATESHFESARLKRITGAQRHLKHEEDLLDLLPGRGVLVFGVSYDPHFITPGEPLMIMNGADSTEKRPEEICLYVRGNISIENFTETTMQSD